MKYVLVHGSWQGGWCWKLLAEELLRRGHQVSCPDLPGHGFSSVPLSEVTYASYYQSLVNEILRVDEPVVLVAHSMSGILAAPLLDQYPERISHLFLIAAYVAQNGKSLLDLALAGGPSEIPKILLNDEENKTQRLELRNAKEALYHDCTEEAADWAISQLQAQPTIPLMTPVPWKDSGKTRDKRTYLFCEEDRDVHPLTQSKVLDDYPCKVVRLKSGHFPFISQPRQVADIIS